MDILVKEINETKIKKLTWKRKQQKSLFFQVSTKENRIFVSNETAIEIAEN